MSIVVSSSLPSVIGKAGSESPTGVSGSNADATDEASNAETVRRVKRDLRIFKPHWKIKTIAVARSEEHTSELQSLMRISYAVFCLKKKIKNTHKCTERRRNSCTIKN